MAIKKFPKNSRILDLGSGSGVPVARFLATKGYKVIGIDFADGMIKLARKNVPKARFVRMDITKMKFKPKSFDGAVSFYAMIHVPREKHARVYRKLHRVLKPDSHVLFNASGDDKDGCEEYKEDYLGVPMFWSYYGPKKISKIIIDAGFEIVWSKVLRLGGENQFWVLAKNK